MSIKSIESKQDLEIALKRVEELWDVAEPNTSEGDELDALVCAIEVYEKNIIVQSTPHNSQHQSEREDLD